MNNFKCPYCGQKFYKTQCPKPIIEKHEIEYIQVDNIKSVASGTGLLINEQSIPYSTSKSKIKVWEPENFNQQLSTIWNFPDRGNWATHSGKYRGNWSPFIPRNIILRYSQENDIILDQFVGSGTTLVEAKLLNRRGIGVDINPDSVYLSMKNIDFERENCGRVAVRNGDARNLEFIPNDSIDLICTHPPYANIIKYSENINGDLSHCDIDAFIAEMEKVALESYRVIKKGKFCAILIGDIRRNGHVIPMGFNIMEVFNNAGFKLKEIIIKEQHNCSSTGFWRNQSIKYNFLLIAHEYLFVFKK